MKTKKIKKVNLTPCISFLNFRTIPEFFEWAEKFPKSHVAFNLIHNKHFLNYRFIPMENRTEMQTWEMIMGFVVGLAIVWWYAP